MQSAISPGAYLPLFYCYPGLNTADPGATDHRRSSDLWKAVTPALVITHKQHFLVLPGWEAVSEVLTGLLMRRAQHSPALLRSRNGSPFQPT